MSTTIQRLLIGITIVTLAVVGLQQGPLADSAQAKAKTSKHCGVTAVWTIPSTYKPAKGITVKMWGRWIDNKTTGWCFEAHRDTVAKKTYMSMYARDQKGVANPGPATSGKNLKYNLLVKTGDTKSVTLKIWKKKGVDGVKTLKSYHIVNVG